MFGNISGARRLRYLCTLWSTYCSDADIQYYPCSFVYSSSWYVSEKIANINGYVYMPGMILMFLIPVILRNCGARIVVRSCIGRVLARTNLGTRRFSHPRPRLPPRMDHSPGFPSRAEVSFLQSAQPPTCVVTHSPVHCQTIVTILYPAQPSPICCLSQAIKP